MLIFERMRFYLIPILATFLLLMGGMSHANGFQITDTQGKTHTLAGYKGKWVLVNYWATWCPPCLEEIPDLVALHEDRRNNLVVIGVALDYRSDRQVIDFADKLQVTYPIVLGTPAITRQIGPVQGLPTTYLFNPDGRLVAQQVGAITRESVQKYIASQNSRTQKK